MANISPLSASIDIIFITSSTAPTYKEAGSSSGIEKFRYFNSIRNSIDWYRVNSNYYNYNSILNSTGANGLLLVNIPSLFYGQSLKRGSIELFFYYSGSLIGKLQDINYNGELIQTLPYGSNGSGSTAGIVLYNEGIILLSGSTALNNDTDCYVHVSSSSGETTVTDNPRWIHWGKSFINSSSLSASSFEFNFEGNNYTPSMTLFAHANKSVLNTSNNPTYIEKTDTPVLFYSSSNSYIENDKLTVKNTVYEPYTNYTGSFQKQTFINKIGVYDQNKNLIAVVKLAKPIKKTDNRDLTFKIKLDL